MLTYPARSQNGLPARCLVLVLLAALLCVPGCANKYGVQKTSVQYYPDCYEPITELRSSENTGRNFAAGGAAAGAALGALIGYGSSRKASGALIGGAIGAIAGGAAGGIYGQHAQDKNDAALLADYNARLDGGIAETNKATAAAKMARQCYERQFATAASEYKAGRLSREEFNARYVEVTSGMEEAAEILGMTNRKSAETAQTYAQALQQEKQRVSSERKAGGKTRTSQAQAQAQTRNQNINTIQKKTTEMQRSVSAGEEEERLLLQRLSVTHQQARDLMS